METQKTYPISVRRIQLPPLLRSSLSRQRTNFLRSRWVNFLSIIVIISVNREKRFVAVIKQKNLVFDQIWLSLKIS